MSKKKNADNNKSKSIDQLIDILSLIEPGISKETKAEESDDAYEVEGTLWKLAAEKKREQEILKHLQLDNIDFSDNIIFRRKLTFILMKVTVIWLIFIAVLIVFQGLYRTIIPTFHGNYIFGFHLDNSVMIALLSTTTITVLGLFLAVTHHIFHRSNKEK